ncbi:ASCH domain-containing protein [Cnuibacter physcomitrellae]|uniref:ASCH domain-containing protein n=1 Tax=Cnuibacter physcomitrellae TaxID=1619308 RepID=UPI002175E770|nr:ASCH domain-containing protein [Cnuibacter physcomitrellae]MCS5498131.1 ASCH domain-containing protein [Cnuibacter physcomitrellae]
MNTSEQVTGFWTSCRAVVGDLPETPPEAWAFGATAEQAEDLLALVLAGTKTATASSVWDYEFDGEPLPADGDYSIVLDGHGVARAVIRTVAVTIVPFDEVSEAHAHAEGEGDRTLAWWRDAHERFWRTYSTSPRGFDARMPVVCEEFRLVYPPGVTRSGRP